jgi:Uma2 family endonuclease
MSAQPQSTRFTLGEYFALERASDRRFEYRDGEVVCMSGGSWQHTTIARNAFRALDRRLRKPCVVFGADAPVYVPAGQPYRYADGSVVCGEPRFRRVEAGIDALENAVLLVEVLSPTSADYDRGTKFEEYKSVPSFSEYLLISQNRPQVARRTRNADGSWIETVFESLDQSIQLESIATELVMPELYEGVRFDKGGA